MHNVYQRPAVYSEMAYPPKRLRLTIVPSHGLKYPGPDSECTSVDISNQCVGIGSIRVSFSAVLGHDGTTVTISIFFIVRPASTTRFQSVFVDYRSGAITCSARPIPKTVALSWTDVMVSKPKFCFTFQTGIQREVVCR